MGKELVSQHQGPFSWQAVKPEIAAKPLPCPVDHLFVRSLVSSVATKSSVVMM